jgi:hypothetical protein
MIACTAVLERIESNTVRFYGTAAVFKTLIALIRADIFAFIRMGTCTAMRIGKQQLRTFIVAVTAVVVIEFWDTLFLFFFIAELLIIVTFIL